ncbi:MAG: hypothetical protein L0332_25080 [Chloroflexi bacterium]|nr:hypothetical protein [Chloroflexota bacterium]MCI0575164.1 hypothetical protein [Chloroflexota bacterium]MCI0647154.1 hypothetical protein [Chloroflexota bacterium]MCI0729970.1 hypothetical protein [Chloroflexota bacterium]
MQKISEVAETAWPINPNLVWDYDIPDDAAQNEAFRRWYLTRVLTRGSANDIRAIGLATIHAYLPVLNLPVDIRDFWEWYFNLPAVKARYGHLNPSTAASS